MRPPHDWQSDDLFGLSTSARDIEVAQLRNEREQVSVALRLAEAVKAVVAHTAFRPYRQVLLDLAEVAQRDLLNSTSERDASICIGRCQALRHLVSTLDNHERNAEQLALRLRELDNRIGELTTSQRTT